MVQGGFGTDKEFDILVVDDVAANLRVLSEMLREDGLATRLALSGEAALTAAAMQPPDLVLLDVMMPELDGFEVCRRLKAMPGLVDVPVIFLSALSETTDKVEAFSAGGVDYITKPFQVEEVLARVHTHLRLHRLQASFEEYSRHLEDLVAEQVKEIAEAQMATIYALARLSESRDDDTGMHLERVRRFCGVLSAGLVAAGQHDEIDDAFTAQIEQASLLHDIGKVAIADSVLLKPGRLDESEFDLIKTHTTLGAATLEAVRDQYPRNTFIAMGVDITRSHHEHWNGRGYPDGLEGDQIPLCARIMAVADVYDALRSRRVYKRPHSHEEARAIIIEGRGAHFDPAVVDAFLAAEEEFELIARFSAK